MTAQPSDRDREAAGDFFTRHPRYRNREFLSIAIATARAEGYREGVTRLAPSQELEPLGWPIALAVQDGATVDEVRDINPAVVFVGGTTFWKIGTAGRWCANFPRVHVGRGGRRIYAHRWSYERFRGAIPAGLQKSGLNRRRLIVTYRS